MSAHQEITQELRTISEAVANLDNTNVFGVPSGYFESLPEKIMKRIRENEMTEELELSPLLTSLKKENPFQVPDGYFENANFNIPQNKTRVFPLLERKSMLRYAVAASFTALVLSVSFYVFRVKNQELNAELASASMTKENVSDDAMQSYLNDLESFTAVSSHHEEGFGENLLVQMDRETVSRMLAEVSETGIGQFMTDNNSEIKNEN